jgi:hypothetical protein
MSPACFYPIYVQTTSCNDAGSTASRLNSIPRNSHHSRSSSYASVALRSNFSQVLSNANFALRRSRFSPLNSINEPCGSNRKAGVREDQQRERHGASERETFLEVRLYIDIPKSLCSPGCVTSHLLGATIETTRVQRRDAVSECKQGRGT